MTSPKLPPSIVYVLFDIFGNWLRARPTPPLKRYPQQVIRVYALRPETKKMMGTPKEDLQKLEVRVRNILEALGEVIKSADDLRYDQSFFRYEAPYNTGVVMGELDSSVQNMENSLQMLIEREK